MRLLPSLLVLAACGPDVAVIEREVDDDGDGYTAAVDCDDAHATVNPDAPERCDGVDNDCDAIVDEDATDAATWYADGDADGHGDPAAATVACEAPLGGVSGADDCDDADASAFPGHEEVCDGVDNDCDGVADDGATDADTWYTDADGDGYGDPATARTACDGGADAVLDASDCDDADADVHPGHRRRTARTRSTTTATVSWPGPTTTEMGSRRAWIATISTPRGAPRPPRSATPRTPTRTATASPTTPIPAPPASPRSTRTRTPTRTATRPPARPLATCPPATSPTTTTATTPSPP